MTDKLAGAHLGPYTLIPTDLLERLANSDRYSDAELVRLIKQLMGFTKADAA